MKYRLLISFLILSLGLHAQTIIVDQRTKDTTVITTKDTTIVKYNVTTTSSVVKLTTVVVKPYKEPTTPVPVPTSKYLELPVSNKLTFTNRSNFTIENLRFENVTGAAITLTGCSKVTIRNCTFNKATEEAISAERCNDVTAEANLFIGVATGVYAIDCQNVAVRNNQSANPNVRPIGGRGNLTQFNGTTNGVIENNRSVAFPGENNIEDHISLYASSGVNVRNNILVGGGPSASGSGIMTGDHGGGNHVVENNTLLSTGSTGIGIAGGTNITVRGNKIYGERTGVSNNPLYVWNQYKLSNGQMGPCNTHSVTGNFVNWTDKSGGKNPGWDAGNCSGVNYPLPSQSIDISALGIPTDWNQLLNFITPAEWDKVRGK